MTLVVISPNKRGASSFSNRSSNSNLNVVPRRETLAFGNNVRCGTPRTPSSCKFANSPPKISKKEQPLWLFHSPPPVAGTAGTAETENNNKENKNVMEDEQEQQECKSPSLLQQAFHRACWFETSPPPPPKPSRYSPSRVAVLAPPPVVVGRTKFLGGELDIPFNVHASKRSLSSLFDLVVCEDVHDDKESQDSSFTAATIASPPSKRNKHSNSKNTTSVLLAPRRNAMNHTSVVAPRSRVI